MSKRSQVRILPPQPIRNMKTRIIIQLRFEGYHRWKDAPDNCAYLRQWHRHQFWVRVEKPIRTSRQIEFNLFKNEVQDYLFVKYRYRKFECSCEEIAEDILINFKCNEVEVLEDGENGAVTTAG